MHVVQIITLLQLNICSETQVTPYNHDEQHIMISPSCALATFYDINVVACARG